MTTNQPNCLCTDKEHDHSKICQHTGISGQTNDHDNWICNWCDFENGKPSESTRQIHKDFTNHLRELKRRV